MATKEEIAAKRDEIAQVREAIEAGEMSKEDGMTFMIETIQWIQYALTGDEQEQLIKDVNQKVVE